MARDIGRHRWLARAQNIGCKQRAKPKSAEGGREFKRLAGPGFMHFAVMAKYWAARHVMPNYRAGRTCASQISKDPPSGASPETGLLQEVLRLRAGLDLYLDTQDCAAVARLDQPGVMSGHQNAIHLGSNLDRCDTGASDRIDARDHCAAVDRFAKVDEELDETAILRESETIVAGHIQPFGGFRLDLALEYPGMPQHVRYAAFCD